MEILLLVGLVIQVATLVAVFVLFKRVQTQIADVESRQGPALDKLNAQVKDEMETIVAEIKDHFEINLGQLSRDNEEMLASLDGIGDSSSRALALQELAFSEATTGNTRIQDLLSENYRRQQKQFEELISESSQSFRDTSAGVENSIRAALEKHNKALLSLGESSQKMLTTMAAHFNNLGSDSNTLKKAAAALLNHNKASDEQLQQHLEAALKPLQQQLVSSRSDLLAASVQQQQTLLQVHEQTAKLESVAEGVYSQQRHLQAIRENTGGLVDAHVSLREQADVLKQLQAQSTELGQALQQMVDRQLTLTHFEEAQRSISQALDDLAVVMQPLLNLDGLSDSMLDSGNQADALTALQQTASETLSVLQQRYETLVRQGDVLAGSLDAAQTTLYTEMDSVRAAQVKANEQIRDLQRLLGQLRLQQTSLLASPVLPVVGVSDNDGLLRIESGEQIQYLSGSRLERLEDRISGEETRFFYNSQGQRSSAETYAGGCLRQRMFFNEVGAPLSACEFDQNGRELVQYFYDTDGNVTNKRELHYDASGMPLGATESNMM